MADDNNEGPRRDDAKAAHAAVLADVAKAGWGPTVRFALLEFGHRLPWFVWSVIGVVGGGGALTAVGQARGWLA